MYPVIVKIQCNDYLLVLIALNSNIVVDVPYLVSLDPQLKCAVYL
jgi:hypothetical protein